MFSPLNKALLFLIFLLILIAFSITGRGEALGFSLSGKLDFHGFNEGTGSWGIGKAMTIIPGDIITYKHLAELEGKKIRITIEVIQ